MNEKEDFISHTTAKLAKELGFDWPTPFYYEGKKLFRSYSLDGPITHPHVEEVDWNGHTYDSLSAPSQNVLRKWLFLTYGVLLWVEPMSISSAGGFSFCMLHYENGKKLAEVNQKGSDISLSLAEALEEGFEYSLNYLIENDYNRIQ